MPAHRFTYFSPDVFAHKLRVHPHAFSGVLHDDLADYYRLRELVLHGNIIVGYKSSTYPGSAHSPLYPYQLSDRPITMQVCNEKT